MNTTTQTQQIQLFIAWGASNRKAIEENNYAKVDYDLCEYFEFDTEAEKKAFLMGIECGQLHNYHNLHTELTEAQYNEIGDLDAGSLYPTSND